MAGQDRIVFQSLPLNLTRAEALAYTGWAPKFFEGLERARRIDGRPWGRNGAKLYSRAQLEAVDQALHAGGGASDIDHEFEGLKGRR